MIHMIHPRVSLSSSHVPNAMATTHLPNQRVRDAMRQKIMGWRWA